MWFLCLGDRKTTSFSLTLLNFDRVYNMRHFLWTLFYRTGNFVEQTALASILVRPYPKEQIERPYFVKQQVEIVRNS